MARSWKLEPANKKLGTETKKKKEIGRYNFQKSRVKAREPEATYWKTEAINEKPEDRKKEFG